MEESLKKRIEEDLRKAGRASEMLAIETFLKRRWSCEGSAGFRDKENDVWREVDIHADHNLTRPLGDSGIVQVKFRIIAEVKKSEKAWVALRERGSDILDAWTNLTHVLHLPDDRVALEKELSRHSLLEKNGWRARGIHEAFKKPSAPDISHGAFISVCKAAEAFLDADETSFRELGDIPDSVFVMVVKPVVILDGLLACASLDADGAIHIDDTDGAALRFQFRTEKYTRDQYRVDLVTLDSLDGYIELCEKRTEHFLETLTAMALSRRGET